MQIKQNPVSAHSLVAAAVAVCLKTGRLEQVAPGNPDRDRHDKKAGDRKRESSTGSIRVLAELNESSAAEQEGEAQAELGEPCQSSRPM